MKYVSDTTKKFFNTSNLFFNKFVKQEFKISKYIGEVPKKISKDQLS